MPGRRTGKAPQKQKNTPAKGKASKKPRKLAALEQVALLMALTLQTGGQAEADPKVREAEKLLEEVLGDKSKASFEVRAQALAVKGLYSRALGEYTRGLREKGLLAPRYANTLLELIDSHPGLKRPESLTICSSACITW